MPSEKKFFQSFLNIVSDSGRSGGRTGDGEDTSAEPLASPSSLVTPSSTNVTTEVEVVPLPSIPSQPSEDEQATDIANDSDYTPSHEIVSRTFQIVSHEVAEDTEPLLSPSSTNVSTDAAVESLRSDDSASGSQQMSDDGGSDSGDDTHSNPLIPNFSADAADEPLSPIPSAPLEDIGAIESIENDFDTDAIVDGMSNKDLRGLTKNILRLLKENNDNRILSEIKDMIDRQQHQRQNGNTESTLEDDIAASETMDEKPDEKGEEIADVSDSAKSVPAEKMKEIVAVDDMPSENVQEDSPTENAVEEADVSDSVNDTIVENAEKEVGVSDLVDNTQTDNVEETSYKAEHAVAKNVNEAAGASDSVDEIPTGNAKEESKRLDAKDSAATESSAPVEHTTTKAEADISTHSGSTSLDPSHPDSIFSLPPLLRDARSHDSDMSDAAKPVSRRKSTELDTSLVMSPTIRTSNKVLRLNMSDDGEEKESATQGSGKRQLVILCNRKPATAKECKDQELAMALCKSMGIIPCVIVSSLSAENSTPTKEERLLAESMPKVSSETGDIPPNNVPTYTYPQFFVRNIFKDQGSDKREGIVDYKGDYDTMKELYQTGKFGADSLENHNLSKLKTFIAGTSEPTSTRFGGSSIGEPSLPSLRHKTTEMTTSSPPRSRSRSPENLDGTNSSRGSSTNNSSGSMIITEEEHESSATSEPVDLSTIQEEEEEKTEQSLNEPEKVDNKDQPQEGDLQKSSVSMTVLSSGAIVKRETVMLKPRPRAEPPGSVAIKDNNSSRFLSQARSSLRSPPTSPQKVPSKPVESKPKKIMNPYYALSYYSGGKSNDTDQESHDPEAESIPEPNNDAVDPPGEDSESLHMPAHDREEEALDPPGEDGDSISKPKQGSDEGSKREPMPWEKKFTGIGACYLVFHSDEDELNIHYSESPMENAVGVWTSPDISNFKESQGLSECELIGTCASHVTQDDKHFCQGWCQFIKAAKIMDGTVTAVDTIGLAVEFYLYDKGRTIQVSSGDGETIFDTQVIDAIACVPKGCDFPATGIVGKKWGKIAKKLGAVALFKSLSTKKSKDVDNGSLVSKNTDDSKIVREVSVSVPIPVPDPRDESLSTLNTFDVVTPVPVAQKSLSAIIDWDKSPPLLAKRTTSTVVESESNEPPSPDEGACYLVYDPDSSGQLVEHYSKNWIDFAIGRWIPGTGKNIANFKFKRNVGRNVLIQNCSGGVQGRKNFYSGWCQFVRSAKNMKGYVTLWDTVDGRKGLKVDVCLYMEDSRPTHQTVRMEEGVPYDTDKIIAVACLPKGTPFFDNMKADLLMWLSEGSKHGYSSKM